MTQIARPVAADQLVRFVEQPLLQVPAELRPAVWNFSAYWSDVLKSDLGLCTRVRNWLDAGATPDEVRAGLDRLTRFGETTAYQFAGQLLAALELAVVGVRQDRDRAADRGRRSAAGADALRGEELRAVIRRHGYGRPPPEPDPPADGS